MKLQMTVQRTCGEHKGSSTKMFAVNVAKS
jgi:hypothetical protein